MKTKLSVSYAPPDQYDPHRVSVTDKTGLCLPTKETEDKKLLYHFAFDIPTF